MVLVIDNYDSFTYNLVQYLGELGAEIRVHRNDQVTVDEVAAMRPARIVVSPGPGRPENAGVTLDVIRRFGATTPILGVCLGHQAIGVVYGGTVCRAKTPMHGKTSTVVHDGKVHVCSTPLAEEGNAMSIWSRIRKLLRLKPTVGERVRDLTAQRVRLEQQRHDIDRRVNSLEAEEVECVKKGAASKTAVEKRQLAGKLARLRRELGRHKGQAGMLSKQIDILGTHVHHITLTERGKQIELPSSEELTQQAAQAEQMVTELSANAELAAGIEISGVSEGLSDEEEAILAEFEAAGDESTKSTAPPEAAADEASARQGIEAPPAASAEPVDTPPISDPPTTARGSTEKGESARPELS